MKRILCIVMIICLLVLLLAACSPDHTKIRIGVLSGPTALGALKLWSGNDPRYEFTL